MNRYDDMTTKEIAVEVISSVAASLVLWWVAMLLWNALVPPLFGGPEIGYWQAAGLSVLASILSGGSSKAVKR